MLWQWGAFVQPLLKGKALNVTYYKFVCVCVCACVCVCSLRYPAHNAHAPYCHLWSVRLYNIFPYYFTNGTIFEKKVESKMCVLIFSLNFMWNISYFKNNWAKYGKNVYWSSCKVPLFLSNINEPWICRHILRNNQLWKFLKILPVVAELFHANGQKDRQMDGHNEANSHFCNFANSSRKININLNFNAVNFLPGIIKSDTLSYNWFFSQYWQLVE
jgi:hypothetical protein